ncbi:PEGA domain protein [Enhygromyxa salina]|uniref:PEGA domain protein n=1 Tax=Enhygromyxa salina TaxID=215803 RepID=A0A2S9XEZ9_9BACT|nr:PEGA domain-containing protein [Enhygromyxa salina]PRP91444.1 PEGA domain protein [Enhygromyxa salina]
MAAVEYAKAHLDEQLTVAKLAALADISGVCPNTLRKYLSRPGHESPQEHQRSGQEADSVSATSLGVVALSLLVLQPAAPVDAAAGLSFEDGIPKREQAALADDFGRMLGMACEPPPCVEDCAADEASLSARIGGTSRVYSLDWVVSDPRLDAPLTLASTCELCSVAELEEQLATDLDTLCTRLAVLDKSPSRVQINTDPDGAQVRIDGRAAGRSPWIGELVPGEHHVEVRFGGYESEERTLQIVGGLDEREDFVLVPKLGRGRPAWPGWTSLSLGVALGIAGTALIAMHGKDWPGRCTGINIDVNGTCRFSYTTRNLGVGLAAGGAAMFATGVGLVVWAQRGQVSAGLTWRGRF